MEVGVAQEQTHRGRTVVPQDGAQSLTIQVESFVPGGWGQCPVSLTNHRLGEPIGVGVEFTERRALRADVAATEHVLGVATDVRDLVAVDRHGQATGGLTQVASHRWQTRSAIVTPRQAWRGTAAKRRSPRV